MDQIISVLTYLGITPKQLVPAIIIGGLYLLVLRKWFSGDIRTIKTSIEGINTSLEVVKDEVRDLHNATKEIQMYLTNNADFTPQHSLEQKPLFEQYGKHASPMQPNDNGQRLLADSHFFEMYAELKDLIFKNMDEMKARTLYDYESAAFRALVRVSNEPAMDQVKEYAVNHPDESLELIFGIASWVIRDDYATYKGTPVSHDN